MGPLEKAFKAECDKYRMEFEELISRLNDLSEKTGIPYGTHIPDSMTEKWNTNECDDDGEPVDYLEYRAIGKHAPVDTEFWFSSTAHCEYFSR